jgi:uncharacterized protein (TIGR03067 family)
MRCVPIFWLALVVPVGGAPPSAADKELRQGLQGTWLAISAESGGEKAPAPVVAKMAMRVRGDRVTFTLGGEPIEATFTVNAGKDPAWFDTREDGREPIRGIISLEKDVLRLCSYKRADRRPQRFAAGKGSEAVLWVFKRSKK